MASDLEKRGSDVQLSLNGANGNGNTVGETNEHGHKASGSITDDSQDYARQIAALSPEEYAAMDKHVLRKMDRNIIPWITLL
jgi:hypothetical protein